MQPRDVRVYLLDAQAAAEEIVAIRDSMSGDSKRMDRIVRAAVERHLITIGEALSKASALDPALESGISHLPAIIGMRNRLVHGYFAIDAERVALVLASDIDVLLSELRALLAR